MSLRKEVSVENARLKDAVHEDHGMRISQETFDSVVKENMEDFEMEEDEAIADAIAQFQAQGVDLSSVSTMAPSKRGAAGGKPEDGEVDEAMAPIIALCKELVELSGTGKKGDENKGAAAVAEGEAAPDHAKLPATIAADDAARLVAALTPLLEGEDNAPIIAGANGAVPALVECGFSLLDAGREADLCAAVRAVSLCMNVAYNREVLAERGIALLVEVPRRLAERPLPCARSLLALARACVKDENNRQDFMAAGAGPTVIACLRNHGTGCGGGDAEVADAEVTDAHRATRAACDAICALTLGDDPRAALTKAHEHVRELAGEGAIEALAAVTAAPRMVADLGTASAVLSALSKIAARDEFCKKILELDGLSVIVTLHRAHGAEEKFARSACALLRAVSGNDQAKTDICKGPAFDVVLSTLSEHSGSAKACQEACGAINSVALRNPSNVSLIAERGGASLLLQAMRAHPDQAGLQRYACSAVRNLVVRNRELIAPLLEDDIEALLHEAMKRHESAVPHARGALRDLGCKVDLKEEWTGKRGELKQGYL